MRSPRRQDSAEIQQPQHIGDILPDILARYGLVPADVWRTDLPRHGVSQPEPLHLALIEFSLPMSVS